MNKRQLRKREKYTYLLCGKYLYIKPREWNKVKNKGTFAQRRLFLSKLKWS